MVRGARKLDRTLGKKVVIAGHSQGGHAALWAGSALFGARRSRFRPSFWSNALITSLILLGPAIEDSDSGKSVLLGSAMRTSLFIGVALYAWATVWLLERWRRPSPATLQPEGDVA